MLILLTDLSPFLRCCALSVLMLERPARATAWPRRNPRILTGVLKVKILHQSYWWTRSVLLSTVETYAASKILDLSNTRKPEKRKCHKAYTILLSLVCDVLVWTDNCPAEPHVKKRSRGICFLIDNKRLYINFVGIHCSDVKIQNNRGSIEVIWHLSRSFQPPVPH